MRSLRATVVPFFIIVLLLLGLPDVKYIVQPPNFSVSVNVSRVKENVDPLSGLYSVFFTLSKNHGRQKYLYDLYGRDYINSTDADHLVTAMFDSPIRTYFKNIPKAEKYTLSRSIKYNSQNKDRLLKRLTTFDYCLSQPDCKWALTIADDAYLDLNNLREMIRELEEAHDPYVEAVITGHCIDKNTQYVYLQGGSGYLASRQACKILLEEHYWWTYDLSVPDDVMFTDGLQSAGITVYESSSRYFSGHPIENYQMHRLRSSGYRDLPKCLPKGSFKYCGLESEQANRLAVIHPCVPESGLCAQAKFLLEAPDDVKYYNRWDHITLCR